MNRRERRAARKLNGSGSSLSAAWAPGLLTRAVSPTAPFRDLPGAAPDAIDVLLEQGRALAARGDDETALLVACRAILMEETPATRAFFVRALNGFAYFPSAEDMQP